MTRSALTQTALFLSTLLFAPTALAAPDGAEPSAGEALDNVGTAIQRAAEVAADEAEAEAHAVADQAEGALEEGADAVKDASNDALVVTRSTLIEVAHSLPVPEPEVPADATPIEAVEEAWEAAAD